MKIQIHTSGPARHSLSGSAVIIILAMLATMVLLVVANSRTNKWLRNEVKLVDQRETARLAASLTNQPAGPSSPTPPISSP